jgi:predicted dehydrogenase
MMAVRVGWGIIGTGRIAEKFAHDLKLAPHADLVAVGSRSQDRAEAFGRKCNIPHRHGRYLDLFHDPEVDIVYVATPHPGHAPWTIQALRTGKAVLCEKPFAVNSRQAKDMITEARGRSTFLMEGMWTRLLPAMLHVRSLIEEGRIGKVCSVQADFGFAAEFDPDSRLFALELGGGALLDVGVYPVSLCQSILGMPDSVHAWAKIGSTGVDEHCSAILGYRDGQAGILQAAVSHRTSQEAWICGTLGKIKIHGPWWRAKAVSVWSEGEDDEDIQEFPYEGNGFQFEAVEAMRCLHEGLLESPVMPWSDSLQVMEIMDRIREPWGLRYLADRE